MVPSVEPPSTTSTSSTRCSGSLGKMWVTPSISLSVRITRRERRHRAAPACAVRTYQSIVRVRPSRSETVASKPNALPRAGDVGRAPLLPARLGGVEHQAAAESGQLGDQGRQLADRDLEAGAEVHRPGVVVALGGQQDAPRGVLHVEELARGPSVTPDDDLVGAGSLGVQQAADERGHHVRALGVEVIARPVEIHHEQVDRVEPILGTIRLPLDQHHLLGQAVGTVGGLRIAVPQLVLAERHPRVLGIRAHRAHRHELAHAGPVSVLHHQRVQHDVAVEDRPGVGQVEADAADLGGQVQHDVHGMARRTVGPRRCRESDRSRRGAA